MIINLKFFKSFKKPEWATDKRFAKNADRVKNRDLIERLINKELSKKIEVIGIIFFKKQHTISNCSWRQGSFKTSSNTR